MEDADIAAEAARFARALGYEVTEAHVHAIVAVANSGVPVRDAVRRVYGVMVPGELSR